MKIRILPEAENDLAMGADFYEAQSPGLGHYFNDCLASDIESLKLFAGVHERVFALHRCLSKRFPFAIYYNWNEERIDIYAVLDCRQDPEGIAERLRST